MVLGGSPPPNQNAEYVEEMVCDMEEQITAQEAKLKQKFVN